MIRIMIKDFLFDFRPCQSVGDCLPFGQRKNNNNKKMCEINLKWKIYFFLLNNNEN